MRPLQKGLTTKDTKRTKVNNNEKQFPLCPFVTFVVATKDTKRTKVKKHFLCVPL